MKPQKIGQKFLEASTPAPKKSAKIVITIFYESMGGEVLGVDTAPLTNLEATNLESFLNLPQTACVGWARKNTTGHAKDGWCRTDFNKCRTDFNKCRTDFNKCRKVVFPAQQTQETLNF